MSTGPFPSLGVRFKVNEPDVVAESIDGEVILIDLRSGAYYSSSGTGDAIWQALAANETLERVIELVGARYASDKRAIAGPVSGYVAELRDEGLIVESTGLTVAGSSELPAAGAVPFTSPVLEKYTDMQELLLLDPIHDVDPSVGWPFVKPAE